MKNIIKFNCIVLAAVIMPFTSCNDDDNDIRLGGSPNSGTPYSSMLDFYVNNGKPVQTFTVDASAGGTITGAEGTVISFPTNFFYTITAALVTGSVTVELVEIYKTSDMLLSAKHTMLAGGLALKSGGEIFINAKKNGEQLLTPDAIGISGINMQVQMPAINADSMQAFVINDSAGFSMPLNGLPDTNLFSWFPTSQPMISNPGSYVWSASFFGWINCDQPTFTSVPLTTFTAHATDDINTYQTDVFFVFPGRILIHVYRAWSNPSLGNFPWLYAPENGSMTIVAVGVKDGKLYSSFVPVPSILPSSVVDFTLSETTDSQFKTQLEALN